MDHIPFYKIISFLWANRADIQKANQTSHIQIPKNILFTSLFLVVVAGFVAFAFWQREGFYTIVHWYIFVGFGIVLFLFGLIALFWNIYLFFRKK